VKAILETRDIEHVPAAERHGRPSDLLTLWFAPNINIVGLVTGATAIALGLSLPWAIAASVLGTAIGGVLMAYHSAQGPRLGLPQMIQSRAQFGSLGNIIPCLITVVDCVGFALLTYIVAGQALSLLIPMPMPAAIVISGVLSLVIALVGYDLIHRYQRYFSIIMLVLFIVWTVQLAIAPRVQHAPVDNSAAVFLLALAIFLGSTLSWAPFVSDYSRYLPASVSVSRTVTYTFAGTFVSTVWAQALGAVAAWQALDKFSADSVSYMVKLSPAWALWLLALVNFAGQVSPVILEIYTGFLTTMTGILPFRPAVARSRLATRVAVLGGLAVIATVSGVIVNQFGLIDSMSNFLTILTYLLMPWTAINLVDYYLIRKGNYTTEEFFPGRRRDMLVRWPAVIVYLAAFGLEFLFMNSPVFVGPVASALGGADLSWIIGVLAAGSAYYGLQRRNRGSVTAAPAPATEPV
jgi:nucleobase:cation symporter-1, NCS1 family